MSELIKSIFGKNLATTIPAALAFIARALKMLGIIDIPEAVINAINEVALWIIGLLSASAAKQAFMNYKASKAQ